MMVYQVLYGVIIKMICVDTRFPAPHVPERPVFSDFLVERRREVGWKVGLRRQAGGNGAWGRSESATGWELSRREGRQWIEAGQPG